MYVCLNTIPFILINLVTPMYNEELRLSYEGSQVVNRKSVFNKCKNK